MSNPTLEANGNFVHRTLDNATLTIPVEGHVFWVRFVKQSAPVQLKSVAESWVYDFANFRRYSCAGAWQYDDYEYTGTGSNRNAVSVEKCNKDRILLHNPTERDIRLILKRPDSSPPRGSGYKEPGSVTRNPDGSYSVTGQGGEPISTENILLVPTVIGEWVVSVEADIEATFDPRYTPFRPANYVYVASAPSTNEAGTKSNFKRLLFHAVNGGYLYYKEAERLASLVRYKPTITGGNYFFGVDTPFNPVHGGGGYFALTAIHAFEGGLWAGRSKFMGGSFYQDGKWTVFPAEPDTASGTIVATLSKLNVAPDPGYLPFNVYYVSDPNGDKDYNKEPGNTNNNQPSQSQAGENLPPGRDKIIDIPNSSYLAEIYFDNQLIYTTTADELLCTFPIDLIKNGGTVGQLPDGWIHPLDDILSDSKFSQWADNIGSNWGLTYGKGREIIVPNRTKNDFDYSKSPAEGLEPISKLPNSVNLYANTKAYSIARNHHIFLLLEGAEQKTTLDTFYGQFYIRRNCKNNYCCFEFNRLVVIEIQDGAIITNYYLIADGMIKGLPEWIKELDYDGFLNPYFHFPTRINLSRLDEADSPGTYGLNAQDVAQLGTKGLSASVIHRELPIPYYLNDFNLRASSQRFGKFYFGVASYKPVEINNVNNIGKEGLTPFLYAFPFKVWYQRDNLTVNGVGVISDDFCRYYNNINYVKNTVYVAHNIKAGDKSVDDKLDVNYSFNVTENGKRCGEFIGTKIFRDALYNGTAIVNFKLLKIDKTQPNVTPNIHSKAGLTTVDSNTKDPNLKNLVAGLQKNYLDKSSLVWVIEGNKSVQVRRWSCYHLRSRINDNTPTARVKYPYIDDSEKVFVPLANERMKISSIVKYPQLNLDNKSLVYFLTAIRTDREDELMRNDIINPFSLDLETRLKLRD